jgi:hypothetical protein
MKYSLMAAIAAAATFMSAASTAKDDASFPPPVGGGFQVRVVHVQDRAEFMKALQDGRYPRIENQMTRNRRLDRVLLYSGCAVDEKGSCNVTAKVRIFYPTGGLYSVTLDEIKVSTEAPPPEGKWGISQAIDVLGFLDPQRLPVGDFLVLTTFTDHNDDDMEQTSWQVVRVTE